MKWGEIVKKKLFDLSKAKEENRDKPSSDIFIHGSQYSIEKNFHNRF